MELRFAPRRGGGGTEGGVYSYVSMYVSMYMPCLQTMQIEKHKTFLYTNRKAFHLHIFRPASRMGH